MVAHPLLGVMESCVRLGWAGLLGQTIPKPQWLREKLLSHGTWPPLCSTQSLRGLGRQGFLSLATPHLEQGAFWVARIGKRQQRS